MVTSNIRSARDYAIASQTEAEPPASVNKRKLSLSTKIAYGGGDFANQMVWTLASSYLAIFYTDTAGLSAAAVGVLMLVARVLDTFVDPCIGAIAERTQSRFGRFRQWILYGSPVLALFLILTFIVIPSVSEGVKLAYAIITYCILGIVYSAVNVPYGALVNVMTTDPADRTSLTSFRMAATNLAAVLLSLVTVPLLVWLSGVGDGQTRTPFGYAMTAIILGIGSLPFYFFLFAKAKENVQVPEHKTKVPLKTTIRVVLDNGPLKAIFFVVLFTFLGYFGRLATVIYYLIYNVGNFTLLPFIMASSPLAGVVGIAIFTRYAAKFGKRRMCAVSLIGQAVALVALYFSGWGNITVVIVLSLLYGLMTFCMPIYLAMVSDVSDYAEDKTGVRTDGISYGAVSFSTKVASAVGALGVSVMGYFGYMANAQQTPEALVGINLVTNLFPAVCCLLALVPLALYNLSNTRCAEIRKRLDAQGAKE
ncbi:MFS transporter [Klebsiella oxytoca]|uniref:MFS transporter n=1 Tax=Klebsiella oxytoca TaxID=571 RepID=UPI003570F804